MVRVKETEADDVVHEVTINILGLSGIVGNDPVDVTTCGGDLSSSQHSVTSMKAAIAVLSKNRTHHYFGGAPAPLSERLQYLPPNEPLSSFQSDDDNDNHGDLMMMGRTTVIDPKPHYTALWKRPGDSTATATESPSTASFDCTLRVSSANGGSKVAKPRRFELVIALVHGCNNSENMQTLTAVPVGVCELVVGHHHGGGGASASRLTSSSSSSSCNKQIMELPVRRVTKQHAYPCLHIPNPDFKPLSALQNYKQDAKMRRKAIFRLITKKGLCFRGDRGAITRRGQDTNDDIVSRDCTRAGRGGDSLTGSSAFSIASQKQQQRTQVATHLEKAVLRVEVEWKIKEFFEVFLEDPLLDRVPRVTSRRPTKINPPPEESLLSRKKRDPFDEWGDDDPLRSVPVAAGAILTAAFSEVFSCVASETSDFHELLMKTEVDSRALEDIACGVPVLRMAASARPSKRGGGHNDEETALLLETLADCIVHADTFPVQPLAREVFDNSTCNGGIHSSSDHDDSSSFDFLEHLMLGEQGDKIITEHQIHDAELEPGYHIAKDDDSLSTNQKSCLLNPVPSMATQQPSLYTPTTPIDIPEVEETGDQMIKEKHVADCPVPGIELESPVSVSRPPKAHDELVREVFDNPEVGHAGLRVVPYLSIEDNSFLLDDKQGEISPAILLQMRLPSPICHGTIQPKPNQHQTPMKWVQFDQPADLPSLLTDTAEYIQPTKSIPKAAVPSKTVVNRKPRRGNPFPNLAVVEEKLKMEIRQSQILQRYYSKASPLGLQITVPQNGALGDVLSQEAGQNNFADFEDAIDDSFWNGHETRARWTGMRMQLITTEDHAKDTRSFQFEADEMSI